MKKRIMSAMLAAALILSLTACGGENAPADKTAESTDKTEVTTTSAAPISTPFEIVDKIYTLE